MAPRRWLQVLDHLVAAIGVSRISQAKDRGFRKDKCINSVPLLQELHIQGRFAAVEGLMLS